MNFLRGLRLLNNQFAEFLVNHLRMLRILTNAVANILRTPYEWNDYIVHRDIVETHSWMLFAICRQQWTDPVQWDTGFTGSAVQSVCSSICCQGGSAITGIFELDRWNILHANHQQMKPHNNYIRVNVNYNRTDRELLGSDSCARKGHTPRTP